MMNAAIEKINSSLRIETMNYLGLTNIPIYIKIDQHNKTHHL